MQRHPVLFTSLVFAALAVGCSRSSADRAPATPEPASEPAAAPASTERPLTASGIFLDPELKAGCGIAEVETYFAFDSADVKPPEGTVLYQVAKCLESGPLKGRTVRVVGHADPRGGDHYNDELGKSRAQAVREYLVFHGVKHDAIEMLSMGEAGSDKASPAEWSYDRRVDIRLMPVTPVAP